MYTRAWAHLLTKGYVATDGRAYRTTAYPDLFRKIGYEYGGQGDVFLLPKVTDRNGNARYAIHTVTGEMVDVRLIDEELARRLEEPENQDCPPGHHQMDFMTGECKISLCSYKWDSYQPPNTGKSNHWSPSVLDLSDGTRIVGSEHDD